MIGSEHLRGRLRADTRLHHQRVDDAFSKLSLGDAGDLRVFLTAQLAALRVLTPRPGLDQPEAEALAADMGAALRADLRALAAPPPPRLAGLAVDATAMLYVLRGSRMGTQLMARQWRATAVGAATGAGHYLTQDPQIAQWQALCARLAQASGTGPDADAVVASAGAIFDLYGMALAGARNPQSPVPTIPAPARVQAHGEERAHA